MGGPNVALDALITEAGMSMAGLARRVNTLGTVGGVVLAYDYTSVYRWVRKGERPRRGVPELVVAALSERLHRPISLADAGFTTACAGVHETTVAAVDYGDGRISPASWAEEGEAVDRRDVLRLGALAASVGPTSGIAKALSSYTGLKEAGTATDVVGLAEVTRATAGAKRLYQACHYQAVLRRLPGLLEQIQAATAAASGADRDQCWRLAADAYQVTGSVMLKLGDGPLAALAADRSMHAALACQDPIAVGSSTRILTHTLMRNGHPGRAKQVAVHTAETIGADLPARDEATSVYGALVLRAASAAARDDDRTAAHTLLDEADAAASRLGHDRNLRWTAFGPTNVAQHRVTIAVALGDYGTAVHLAQQINPMGIGLLERRAALYIDTATAYTRWGRHEQAHHALIQAEQAAPEEVRTRSRVRHLIRDLHHHAPPTLRPHIAALAHRAGLQPTP